ncbi:hypothetical protein [Flammeovirga sp. SubArs3]|uniref:hypothetical protein n=1 Tax=Flammeovirga sp. SubArs3 TaxID=2995316 RepID=UPI00248BD4BE|nr:hypothetical protein [Flammeovirga sp. SubArs3]
MTYSTTIQDQYKKMLHTISQQIRSNSVGELEILHKSIHQLCKLSGSSYGFIGLVEDQHYLTNYKQLIECNQNHGRIPMMGNGPLSTPSKAHRYLKLSYHRRVPFFSFDQERFNSGMSWFSYILIPIYDNSRQVGLIGLCDRKSGYDKNFILEISPICRELRKIILQNFYKTDISRAQPVYSYSVHTESPAFDIMLTIDDFYNTKLSNIVWTQYFGSNKALITDLIVKEDHASFYDLIQKARTTGLSQNTTLRFKRKNKTLYFKTRILFLRKSHQIQIIAQDISDRFSQSTDSKVRKDYLRPIRLLF